jgi:hypothetical protein
MNENSLKKLIVESTRRVLLEGHLQDDVSFLKDYHLLGSKMVNGAKTWKFEFKTPDNSYLSHAFFVQYPNDSWKMRLEVDWKVTTKHNTAGAGKDFVMTFGPFTSLDEMISELNRRLHNNPMIGTDLYNDNNDSMLDREIVGLLKRIKEGIGEIKQLNHPSLKTLENMYEVIKDIPDDQLQKFCDDQFKGWLMKQGIIYKLQGIDKLPYYRSLRSSMHAPRTEPFAQKQ